MSEPTIDTSLPSGERKALAEMQPQLQERMQLEKEGSLAIRFSLTELVDLCEQIPAIAINATCKRTRGRLGMAMTRLLDAQNKLNAST